MAWLTLAQLRTTVTEEEARADILASLSALGFDADNWQSGSVVRTLVEAFADVYASFSQIVSTLSELAFIDSATGDAQTALASSHYDYERVSSTSAVVSVRFSNSTGGALPTPSAIDVVCSDSVTGLSYTAELGVGVIPAGGTYDIDLTALEPGEASNAVSLGPATLTVMSTPIAGVSVENIDIGGGTSLATAGVDEELDSVLAARCKSRWATLSYAAPALAYENFALAADTDITRVLVDDDNPAGPGTVYVYMARSDRTATGADVTTVQTYVDTKRPATADVTVIAATEQAQSVIGTVYVDTTLLTAAKQTEIEDAARDFINSIDIGGTVIGGTGYMLYSELVTAMSSVDGVSGVVLSTPAAGADTALTSDAHVLVTAPVGGAINLTYVAV